MRSLVTKALLVATLALPMAAVPAMAAQQQQEEGPNPSRACSSAGDLGLTHGACASYAAKGELTGAGYSAQCKNLARELGGYPFTFYEPEPLPTIEVKNHGECVNALRFLHTTYGGE